MSFFSGTKSKLKVDPTKAEARKELLKRGKESVDIPAREIASLTETELAAIRRGEEFAAGGITPELLQSIELTRGIATDTSSVVDDPGLQAIFREITKQGETESGRLGRKLQKQGTLSSTRGGRDQFGRLLSDVEGRKVASAVPFLESEKNRRFNAILNLAGLGERKTGEEQERIKTGLAVGSIPRAIEQAVNDEKLNAILANLQFRFGTQASILQGVSQTGTDIIAPGGPSGLEKAASIAKTISSISSSVAGFGGGSGTTASGGSGGNLNTPGSFDSSSFFKFN